MDMTEIAFEALSREVSQGDEGLPVSATIASDIASDLGVTAGVALLVAEASVDLGGGMSLLGRRVLIVAEDLVDGGLDRPKGWRRSQACRGEWVGMGKLEDLPDSVA
jgi:hypothetical protein